MPAHGSASVASDTVSTSIQCEGRRWFCQAWIPIVRVLDLYGALTLRLSFLNIWTSGRVVNCPTPPNRSMTHSSLAYSPFFTSSAVGGTRIHLNPGFFPSSMANLEANTFDPPTTRIMTGSGTHDERLRGWILHFAALVSPSRFHCSLDHLRGTLGITIDGRKATILYQLAL